LQWCIVHWVFPRHVQDMHLALGQGGFAVAVWVEESGVVFCWAALRGCTLSSQNL
jgi:hypothetical protein